MKKTMMYLLILVGPTAIAQVSYSGEWTKKSYAVEGRWEIIKDQDGYLLRLDQDFSTKKAPDLKIFFSPKPVDEINAKNALAGAVKISELKTYKGRQEFKIPRGVSAGAFKTLLIHCEQYDVLWSVAKLN